MGSLNSRAHYEKYPVKSEWGMNLMWAAENRLQELDNHVLDAEDEDQTTCLSRGIECEEEKEEDMTLVWEEEPCNCADVLT